MGGGQDASAVDAYHRQTQTGVHHTCVFLGLGLQTQRARHTAAWGWTGRTAAAPGCPCDRCHHGRRCCCCCWLRFIDGYTIRTCTLKGLILQVGVGGALAAERWLVGASAGRHPPRGALVYLLLSVTHPMAHRSVCCCLMCPVCGVLQDVAPPLDEISRFNAAGQAEADDMNVSASQGGGWQHTASGGGTARMTLAGQPV